MSSRHRLTAIWMRDEENRIEDEVEITFDFHRPTPARLHGPLTAPAEDARVDFVSAKTAPSVDGFDSARQESLDAWAEGWLTENEADAIDKAYDDIFAQDDARDAARSLTQA